MNTDAKNFAAIALILIAFVALFAFGVWLSPAESIVVPPGVDAVGASVCEGLGEYGYTAIRGQEVDIFCEDGDEGMTVTVSLQAFWGQANAKTAN